MSDSSSGTALRSILSDPRSGGATPTDRPASPRPTSFLSDMPPVDVPNIVSKGTPRTSLERERFELLGVWQSVKEKSKARKTWGNRRMTERIPTIQGLDEDFALDADLEWVRRLMIHPSSMKHIVWDLFGYLLIVYDCVVMPWEAFEPPFVALFEAAMSRIICVYWSFHMVKSALTGYYRKQGTVEMSPRKVWRHYAVTFFVFDLFTVGVSWAELATGGLTTFERAVRVLRVVRLCFISRSQEITDFVTEYIRSERVMLVASIGKIMAMMLWVAHLLACFWYGLGRHGAHDRTWVAEEGLMGESFWFRYTHTIHWSLALFTGGSDITPQNQAESVYCSVAVFTAFFVSAYVVSSITSSMTQLNILSSAKSNQMMTLRRYMFDHQISRTLATRVQRNAQYGLELQSRTAPESSIELLKLISEPLLMEMHYEIYSSSLLNHPFFVCYNELNPSGVRKVCHTGISSLHLSSGDTLFSEFEEPTCPRMFYVREGSLRYDQEDKHMVQTIGPHTWMCEATLWTTWRYCGTLQAKSDTQIVVLEAAELQRIFSLFPTSHASNYGEQFVLWLNMRRTFGLSDVVEWDDDLNYALAESFPEWVERVMPGDRMDENGPIRPNSMISRSSDRFSSRSAKRQSHPGLRFKAMQSRRQTSSEFLPSFCTACMRLRAIVGRRTSGNSTEPVVPYPHRHHGGAARMHRQESS